MKYFLRTETPAEMDTALIAAGIVRVQLALINSEGVTVLPAGLFVNDGYSLDIVEKVTRPTGVMILVNDLPMPEMVELPGWHANLIAELSQKQLEILPIIPDPKNPSRVWS